jgi:Metallo-peptidase family M12
MFSVTSYVCATGYYSFGHEIGHNFGMSHDRGTENSCSSTTTFNYGYINPNAEFRTILSYDCKVGQCDKMPKNGCARIQRFSNSNTAYTYLSKPIGDTTRDNARQINNNRALVASYFPAMNCQSNIECNDNDLSTVDTCNTINSVCVFTPATIVPTNAPILLPISVPITNGNPTSAPINPPTNAPNQPQTNRPTRAPTKLPTRRPTRVPTKAPTRAPIRSPTKAPTNAPVLPQASFLESMKITGVTSAAWKLLTFTKSYVSPIPVCTVMYNQGTSLLPAVVRIQNVGSTSLEIRLQNPSDKALSARDVHCLIMEEGAWKLPDGRKIESKKYSSTVTDRKGSYVGQAQAYQNQYSNPVVLGQVMSYNDAKWSVFWSRSSAGQNTAPTSTSIITGKHVGEDSRTTRVAETIGFIVMETGHAKSDLIEIETGRGPDSFIGYTGKKITYKFKSTFASVPVVAVLSQAAMDDSDGSWAVLTANPTTTTVGISVDEDQRSDTERSHSTEEVNYAVFSAAGAIQLTKV